MKKNELKFEYYKSSGPGGQHKNKRFIAVRVTHLPTGLCAVSQENRSQASNKELALERLNKRLAVKFAKKKNRIHTYMPQAAREKILQQKKLQSYKKKLRRESFGDIE